MNRPQPIFRESQHLSPWLACFLIALEALILGSVAVALHREGVLGEQPLLFSGILLLSLGMLLAFLLVIKMSTEVTAEGLRVRMWPILNDTIGMKHIRSAEVRQYNTLREYGGWGLRHGPGGKAYNMRGKEGVQLVLEDGSRLLIGSQRPRELAEAVKRTAGLGTADAK